MGKAGRKKIKNRMNRRHNPTGLQSVRDLERQQQLLLLDNAGEPQPLPALKNLDKLNAEDREAGCLALASLIDDETARRTLMKAGYARKVPRVLNDPNKTVRVAAAGALRNAVVSGGDEMCEALVQDGDVMTAGLNAITQAVEDTTRGNTNEADAIASVIEDGLRVLEQLLPLLAFICEANVNAYQQLFEQRNQVLMCVFECLMGDKMTNTIKLEALQFLMIFTDENEHVAMDIQNNEKAMSALRNIVDSTELSTLMRISAGIVLFNIRLPGQHAEYVRGLLPLLIHIFQFDAVAELSSIFNNMLQARKKDQVSGYVEWTATTKSQRLAFELLTNIINCREVETGDESATRPDISTPDPIATGETGLDPMVMESLNSCDMFGIVKSKMTSMAQQIILSTNDSSSLLRSTTEKVEEDVSMVCSVLERIFTCYGNIIANYDDQTLGMQAIDKLWAFQTQCAHALVLIIDSNAISSTLPLPSLLEVIACVLSSSVKRMGAAVLHPDPSPKDIDLFGCFAEHSNSEMLRIYGATILGGIGSQGANLQLNLRCGGILVHRVQAEESIEVISEVFDAIYELYGGEDFDQNVKELNLLPILVEARKQWTDLIRKNYDHSYLEICIELERFIKYKQQVFAG